MNEIVKLTKVLSYIPQIIFTTPYYFFLIILNLLAGIFILIGYPTLLPAIDFLVKGGVNESDNFITKNLTEIFGILNIEVSFLSLICFASILLLLSQLFLVFLQLFQARIHVILTSGFIKKMIDSYYKTDWISLSKDKSGSLQSAINREAGGAAETHLNALRAFTSSIQLIIYICISFYISSDITILAILFFSFFFIVNFAFSNKVNFMSKNYNDSFISLSNLVNSLTVNKKFFKSSKNYQSFTDLIKKTINDVKEKNWKLLFFDGILQFSTKIAGMAFVVFIFIFHSFFDLSLSKLLIILVVFARLAPQFTSLMNDYMKIVQNIPIHKSVMNKIGYFQKNIEKYGNKKFDDKKDISFQNVEFEYFENQKVINDLSIDIKNKSVVAIVGRSGSGKSTILDLLLGLLKPKKGKIYYGSHNHSEIDIRSFREKVAYISQDTTLIDGTIKENLTIVNRNATDADLKFACENSMLSEFIESLPNGLNTPLGENGISLSGGQKQRLALCRALVTKPEILIFDEATSNLDIETENYIKKLLLKLKSEITILIVSHRFELISIADNVYLIDKGKVKKSGKFTEIFSDGENPYI